MAKLKNLNVNSINCRGEVQAPTGNFNNIESYITDIAVALSLIDGEIERIKNLLASTLRVDSHSYNYYQFSTGLTIQWGHVYRNGSAEGDVVFPIAFKNIPKVIASRTTDNARRDTFAVAVWEDRITTTGFHYFKQPHSDRGLMWFAIG